MRPWFVLSIGKQIYTNEKRKKNRPFQLRDWNTNQWKTKTKDKVKTWKTTNEKPPMKNHQWKTTNEKQPMENEWCFWHVISIHSCQESRVPVFFLLIFVCYFQFKKRQYKKTIQKTRRFGPKRTKRLCKNELHEKETLSRAQKANSKYLGDRYSG